MQFVKIDVAQGMLLHVVIVRTLKDVLGTRLKFYHDHSLGTDVIMSHVLSSETGMPVSRLLRLIDDPNGLMVQVRWRGLPDSEDTLEPISRVYEDVPELFLKLIERKNTPQDLAARARH